MVEVAEDSEKNCICQLCGIRKTYHGIPFTICESCYPLIHKYMEMREYHQRIWMKLHGTLLDELREELKSSPFGIDGDYHLNLVIDDLEQALTKLDGVTIALHNLFVTPSQHLLKSSLTTGDSGHKVVK